MGDFKVGDPHATAIRGVFRKAPEFAASVHPRHLGTVTDKPHIPGDIAV